MLKKIQDTFSSEKIQPVKNRIRRVKDNFASFIEEHEAAATFFGINAAISAFAITLSVSATRVNARLPYPRGFDDGWNEAWNEARARAASALNLKMEEEDE